VPRSCSSPEAPGGSAASSPAPSQEPVTPSRSVIGTTKEKRSEQSEISKRSTSGRRRSAPIWPTTGHPVAWWRGPLPLRPPRRPRPCGLSVDREACRRRHARRLGGRLPRRPRARSSSRRRRPGPFAERGLDPPDLRRRRHEGLAASRPSRGGEGGDQCARRESRRGSRPEIRVNGLAPGIVLLRRTSPGGDASASSRRLRSGGRWRSRTSCRWRRHRGEPFDDRTDRRRRRRPFLRLTSRGDRRMAGTPPPIMKRTAASLVPSSRSRSRRAAGARARPHPPVRTSASPS